MNSKRLATTLVAASATLVLLTGGASDAARSPHPRLAVTARTPKDVRSLAEATWARFQQAFPARLGCLPDVTVAGVWRFPDRARYDPARRLVTLRMPGTAPNLAASLAHEFAHALDLSCRDVPGLRAPFLAAQGLDPATPWLAGTSWERIPSEQYAEAAAQVVVGLPSRLGVALTPAAVAMVRDWGRGS